MARKRPPAELARVSVPDALGSSVPARAKLLELAQVNDAEQALLTRLVINKLRDLLSAKRVQRLVVNAGLNVSEVREFVDEDGALQARASSELIALLGLQPSKTASVTATGPMTINVTLAQRPTQAKVIDVKSAS